MNVEPWVLDIGSELLAPYWRMVGTQTAPNSLHSFTAFNISMFSEMLQSMMPDVCTTMHVYMCKTKSSVFFSRFRTSGPSGAQQFETWPSGYLKDHWSPTNKQRSRLALWIIPPNNGLTTAPCFKAWPDTTWVSGTPRDAPFVELGERKSLYCISEINTAAMSNFQPKTKDSQDDSPLRAYKVCARRGYLI